MKDTMNTFFARRYALGGTLYLLLLLTFAWQFAKLALNGLVGPENLVGLLRLYVVVSLLFVPWFLWTWLTRLQVDADRITWRSFPASRRFRFRDITTIERIDHRAPDSIPRLAISYHGIDGPARVTVTPYTFPARDIDAFLSALRRERSDLPLPEFGM